MVVQQKQACLCLLSRRGGLFSGRRMNRDKVRGSVRPLLHVECVFVRDAYLYGSSETRREDVSRCNAASRLTESHTGGTGAVWELSVLQIYMFWRFSPPVCGIWSSIWG